MEDLERCGKDRRKIGNGSGRRDSISGVSSDVRALVFFSFRLRGGHRKRRGGLVVQHSGGGWQAGGTLLRETFGRGPALPRHEARYAPQWKRSAQEKCARCARHRARPAHGSAAGGRRCYPQTCVALKTPAAGQDAALTTRSSRQTSSWCRSLRRTARRGRCCRPSP